MASFLLVLRWILQECGDFTWRVSDCEELSGSYSQGNDGVDGGDFTWRVVNMNLLLKNRQTNRQH